jgi:hypothetical protein
LTSKMPLKDKTTIANMSASELPHLHLNLGRYILNAFEMLSGNKELIESCREATKKELQQEEDAVPVIIEALWLKLRKTYKLRVIK